MPKMKRKRKNNKLEKTTLFGWGDILIEDFNFNFLKKKI